MSEPQKSMISFELNTPYLHGLWSESRNHHLNGDYIVSSIFSIWAYKTNKSGNYIIISGVAENIIKEIETIIENSKKELFSLLEKYKEKIENPVNSAISVSMFERPNKKFSVPESQVNPVASSFIQLFILTDHIDMAISKLNQLGSFSTSDMKAQEKIAAKPLRRAMHDINIICLKFHKTRKDQK